MFVRRGCTEFGSMSAWRLVAGCLAAACRAKCRTTPLHCFATRRLSPPGVEGHCRPWGAEGLTPCGLHRTCCVARLLSKAGSCPPPHLGGTSFVQALIVAGVLEEPWGSQACCSGGGMGAMPAPVRVVARLAEQAGTRPPRGESAAKVWICCGTGAAVEYRPSRRSHVGAHRTLKWPGAYKHKHDYAMRPQTICQARALSLETSPAQRFTSDNRKVR